MSRFVVPTPIADCTHSPSVMVFGSGTFERELALNVGVHGGIGAPIKRDIREEVDCSLCSS